MTNWIKVSQRLPKNDEPVLIAIPLWEMDGTWSRYQFECAQYNDNGEYFDTEGDSYETAVVEYWQPIVKPRRRPPLR